MIGQEPVRTAFPEVQSVSKPLRGSPSVHLDALRGFAAFSVLLFHWRKALFVDYQELGHHNPFVAAAYQVSNFGHQWVIVFFVMSGYLVGGSVLRSVGSDRWSWRAYLLTRLTRLYIVLLPALLLGGVLDWFGMHLAGTGAIYTGRGITFSLYWNVHSSLSPKVLAANILFLQTIKPPGAHYSVPVFGSNGPLWSLSNEFWYYMAFPLLVLMLAKGWSWWMRVACGFGLVAWGWIVGVDIIVFGIPWLMGVLIALLPSFPARGPITRSIAVGMALALFMASLPVAAKAYDFGWLVHPKWIVDSLLGVIVTFLIWVTLHCATAPLPSAYVKVSQRLSHSSYTLYLTHFPLLIFLTAALHLPRAVPSWHTLVVSTLLLALIVLYSQLAYELFEKHTDRVRKWIKPYVMRTKVACCEAQ